MEQKLSFHILGFAHHGGLRILLKAGQGAAVVGVRTYVGCQYIICILIGRQKYEESSRA